MTTSKFTNRQKTNLVSQHNHLENDTSGIRAWIMRQWFDPKINATDPWYNSDITASNVLEYLETRPLGFKLALPQLRSFYLAILSLQRAMGSSQMEEDLAYVETYALPSTDEQITKSTIGYTSGEVPLHQVGREIGVSATAAGLIAQGATAKLASLTDNVHPNTLTYQDDERLELVLRTAELDAADEYCQLLTEATSPEDFIRLLCRGRYMTEKEKIFISKIEMEVIGRLMTNPDVVVASILIDDLNNPDGNVIKSFQSVYSKFVYGKKVG